MSEQLLSVNGLSKKYKSIQAIDNISFGIKSGEVFGIIGPNGSGKTTTLSIILSLIKPDSGAVEFANDFNRLKIGAYLDNAGFNPQLSVWNNLRLSAMIKNVDDSKTLKDALIKVGLYERKSEVYKNLSLGMKQRLSIATTFVGSPSLIILDEPTNGLDPYGIIEVRELILELNKAGITVIVASHILTEMEKICNRVAIYNKGRLVSVEAVSHLIQQYSSLENAFLSLTKE